MDIESKLDELISLLDENLSAKSLPDLELLVALLAKKMDEEELKNMMKIPA